VLAVLPKALYVRASLGDGLLRRSDGFQLPWLHVEPVRIVFGALFQFAKRSDNGSEQGIRFLLSDVIFGQVRHGRTIADGARLTLGLTFGGRSGELDDRRPTTDDRRPTTDDRRPTTDDRRPTTGQSVDDGRKKMWLPFDGREATA
jgi:hypothetical protein